MNSASIHNNSGPPVGRSVAGWTCGRPTLEGEVRHEAAGLRIAARRRVGGLAACRASAAVERVRRVGVLLVGAGNDPVWQVYADALRQGLTETGYVEGRNLVIEYRWAEGQYDRLPTLATDLVRQRVTVIVAGANPSAVAAKAATTTIPIVFWVNSDPVSLGLVASFNHPGNNLTGVVTLSGELGPKRLELMRELVPAATTFAALVNPINPGSETQSKAAQAAARTLGLQLHVLEASSERDLDTAFATLIQLRAGGLVISSDAFFVGRSEQLATLALRHAVPTIFQSRVCCGRRTDELRRQYHGRHPSGWRIRRPNP